jgi:hypothetical protein
MPRLYSWSSSLINHSPAAKPGAEGEKALKAMSGLAEE